MACHSSAAVSGLITSFDLWRLVALWQTLSTASTVDVLSALFIQAECWFLFFKKKKRKQKFITDTSIVAFQTWRPYLMCLEFIKFTFHKFKSEKKNRHSKCCKCCSFLCTVSWWLRLYPCGSDGHERLWRIPAVRSDFVPAQSVHGLGGGRSSRFIGVNSSGLCDQNQFKHGLGCTAGRRHVPAVSSSRHRSDDGHWQAQPIPAAAEEECPVG